jgi:hypothetical protein
VCAVGLAVAGAASAAPHEPAGAPAAAQHGLASPAPPARMRPAPRLADPSASGRALSARYFRLLQARDTPGLRAFLSGAFQIQRADGTAWGKRAYLAGTLPRITSFSLSRAVGTQAGPTLVVRYRARVSGIIDGRPYANAPAPRLSTFGWDGRAWRLTSHANFEPLPAR